MKSKGFLLWLLTAAVLLTGFAACSDDDDNTPPPPETPTEADADSVGLVFSYDKFLTPEDVEILSADTTSIAVSKEFLASQELEVDTGKAVCIWRTIDTAPFIRIIKGVKDTGTRLELTTIEGDMGDMFRDLDIEMDTELYVDQAAAAPQRRSRAANAVEGVNYNRYMDADSVLHPAVIIVEGDQQVRGATNTYMTAEDLLADNASFKFLNIHTGNIGVDIPLTNSSKFFIKNFHFDAESSLNISVKVKWFKLKQFECSIGGYVETGLTAGVEVKSENQLLKKEHDLLTFPSYTAVFWAGPIPVAIKLQSGIKFKSEAKLTAKATISSTVSFRADYKEGVKYSGGSWSPISSANAKATAELNKVETAISGTAKSGVYLYADLLLYGCAGPELAMGPSVAADVKAAFVSQDSKSQIKLSTSGKLELGGEIGAKLKIWKWTIASWSKDFTFWSTNLWKYEKTYDL